MAYDNNEPRIESIYSQKIRAGKRRTYFFDVRETRGNDFFLTITESRKRFNDNGYDRHKIFVYKEDFNKFIKAMCEAVDYVKTELMPDYDFDAFNHDNYEDGIMAPAMENMELAEETELVEAVEMPMSLVVEMNDAEHLTIHHHLEEAQLPSQTVAAMNEEVDKW